MASRYGLSGLGYRRFPRKDRGASSEEIQFEEDKSTAERVLEILDNVCIKVGVSGPRKCLYLSALVKLLSAHPAGDGTTDLGLRIKEIMLCLRLPLLSEHDETRASALRTVRYLIKNNLDAVSVISVNLHLLIVRILDLDPESRTERLQAVKLARKLLIYGPQTFPVTLVKSLMALTQKAGKQKDSLRRAGLAVLCELSCVNPGLFVSSGCVRFLSYALFQSQHLPRIIESIVGCLLRIYNAPSLRRDSRLDLSNIVAPFTEMHLLSVSSSGEEGRVSCASTALLSLLRSWVGLLHISHPDLETKPLQSLVDILHIQTHQSRQISFATRKLVLDIVFKSLNLQVPVWTEEFDVAMRTADPSAPKDSWKLGEGFTATEGRDILPHLSKSRPNLQENHTCVLLSCYLQAKLPRALVQVIVTEDTVLSVRATVLLGQILHLTTLLLPHEIGSISQCLPELAEHISTHTAMFDKSESNRAISAVTALQRFHALKKNGPRPHSLILEQALQASGHGQGESFVGDKLILPAPSPNSAPPSQSTSAAIDQATLNSIKESQVIPHRDPQAWNWELVMSVLRWPSEGLRRMEDSSCRVFIKKLTEYFKPSFNMFSRLELDTDRTRLLGRIGCCLIDFLVSPPPADSDRRGAEAESLVLLDDLLRDVFACVQEVIDASSPHDCMFSPNRLSNTASQLYFLFIGRLTSSEQGRQVLEKHRALSLLMSLLNSRSEFYLKLVISCVDFRSVDWRLLLSKALSQSSEAGRIYTIKWLGVLARMGATNFAQYGVEFLVNQLKDTSLQVSVAALCILEEVCDDKMYLESLVAAKSSLLSDPCQRALARLGGRGRILLARFLGSGSGFSVMTNNNWLVGELVYWAETFNNQYVLLVEGLTNDGFTLHQRSLEGQGGYGRRSGDDFSFGDVFVPPHLYGQLTQTRSGLDILLGEKAYWSMILLLRDLESSSYSSCSQPPESWSSLEETWLTVKAAIWGLAHVATSPLGATELEKEGLISLLVNIAENCPVLSIKGTAFYALGLVATTRIGTSSLGTRGWATLRHARSDTWPITFEWLGASDDLFPYAAAEFPGSGQQEESPAPSESWREETQSVDYRPWSEVRRSETAEKRRRVKTMSECTDSSLSQNMLELGPSPQEPSFPLPGRLSEKISSWFSSTSGGNGREESKTENKNGTRRFSDGGKLSSSLSNRLRNSFNRKRSKTISAGCTPSREGTPVSSVGKDGDCGEDGAISLRRRLSYSQEESVVIIPSASPETLPGEIFQLENIVEEPGNPNLECRDQAHRQKDYAELRSQHLVCPESISSSSMLRGSPSEYGGSKNQEHLEQRKEEEECRDANTSRSRFTVESRGRPTAETRGIPTAETRGRPTSEYDEKYREPRRSSRGRPEHDTELGDESFTESFAPSEWSGMGTQLETSLHSFSSFQPTEYSAKDPVRSVDIQITFSAQKFDAVTQSSIKQGTSVSSVSSVGSFTFKDNYGQGSLARNRIKRRPQLSESEDGDPLLSQHPTLLRQESYTSKTKSKDYRMVRGGAGGARKSLNEPSRGLSAPLRPLGRFDGSKEPAFWGIAYPLNHEVLYPQLGDKPSSPRLDLPGMVGAWLKCSHQHVAANCLSCCRLRPSARPRAVSLSITKDDQRSSLHLSSSLPSSQQSPELKRKSWNPTTGSSTTSTNLLDPDSPESSVNYEDLKAEAMDLISELNSVFRYKHCETGLNKLRSKAPRLFQDLCFYSDVAQMLGEYDFRMNARKFVQVLFSSVDISQMETEARNILTPDSKFE